MRFSARDCGYYSVLYLALFTASVRSDNGGVLIQSPITPSTPLTNLEVPLNSLKDVAVGLVEKATNHLETLKSHMDKITPHSDTFPAVHRGIAVFDSPAYFDKRSSKIFADIRTFVYAHEVRDVEDKARTKIINKILEAWDPNLKRKTNEFLDRTRLMRRTGLGNEQINIEIKRPGCKTEYFQTNVSSTIGDDLGYMWTEIDLGDCNTFTTTKWEVKVLPREYDFVHEHDETATIWFSPDEGNVAIIDIDDTVRLTNVKNRLKMVKNSFTDPPIPVPGMSQAVNHIKEQLKIKTQKGRGVNKKQAIETFIIYVTAGPNSLEESHAKFLQEFGFPEGLILSRTINVHNMSPHKFSEMDQAAWRFKIGTIQSIFKWFPNKSYYTLGDSGQKDVEVYAKVHNTINQVCIWIIINLHEEANNDLRRFETVFREARIPDYSWRTFVDPGDLERADLSNRKC